MDNNEQSYQQAKERLAEARVRAYEARQAERSAERAVVLAFLELKGVRLGRTVVRTRMGEEVLAVAAEYFNGIAVLRCATKKKDGDWGKALRHVYDDWTIVRHED